MHVCENANNMDEFYAVVKHLPLWLSPFAKEISASQAKTIQEIRLRTGGSIVLVQSGQMKNLCEITGEKSEFSQIIFSQRQIEEVFFSLCDRSVHSFEEELARGFVTVSGHRVGVAGKYIKGQKGGLVLQKPTSLNIRIARFVKVFIPVNLQEKVKNSFKSIVVIGAPSSGKTTVLRELCGRIACAGRIVAVVDEREEIFSPQGDEQHQAMQNIDVISGVEKGKGVQMALRTLSPDVVVFDEIGEITELVATKQGFFAGVDFLASMHANSFDEAQQKPQFQYMQKNGMLRYVCLLAGRENPGKIIEVREY